MAAAELHGERGIHFWTLPVFVVYWKPLLWAGIVSSFFWYTYSKELRQGRLPENDYLVYMCITFFAGCLCLFMYRWWNKPRWVEVFDRGGIVWASGLTRKHRTWNQIQHLHIQTNKVFRTFEEEQVKTADQILTLKFIDGTTLRACYREVNDYADMLRVIYQKYNETVAANRNAQHHDELVQLEAEKESSITQFGPLTLTKKGVEWDGKSTAWDQIQQLQVQQGMLWIIAKDGREFLRRTIELGDWKTAVSRLEAGLKRKVSHG